MLSVSYDEFNMNNGVHFHIISMTVVSRPIILLYIIF